MENNTHDMSSNKDLTVADLNGDKIEDEASQHESSTQSDNEFGSDQRDRLKVRRKLNFDNVDNLANTGFVGSQFTWCNNWGHPKTIWKRLDRLLFNEEWLDDFNDTKVTHLSRTDFIKIIKEVWSMPTDGSAMWQLHCKMKALYSKLSEWSRVAFGDILKDTKEAENQINILEKKLVDDTSEENRSALHKAKAEFTKLFKNQEAINRQRAKAKWLQDGDKNTSYFHKVIKDRRRKLNIHNILDKEGHKVSGHNQVAEVAIKNFKELFRYQECEGSYDILDQIPKLVTEEMNTNLPFKRLEML
ncbi:uncharacterized protein LOC132057854 [Lycium ferocissimum]|uniref:uncharacterized protein LOC132057854 n=1 Tax=Lycium ferocissimum TaxID=112874 RepID=UPI002815E12D|nr:uncharacterized protein LOC132057854 [Lycium ferocissimum]